MKVNLTIGRPALNGYMNIDPTSNPNDPNSNKVCHPIDNLDPIICHNQCDEFLCLDVLDYFPIQARLQTLNHYLCKISHNGTIIVGGLDIRDAVRVAYTRQSLLEDNILFYGQATNVWTLKKSLVTIDDIIRGIMQTNQFNIISAKFDKSNYIVEAKRK